MLSQVINWMGPRHGDSDVFVTDRAIDAHITAPAEKARRMLAWMIHTVRGVGYRLLEKREESEGGMAGVG